MVERRRRNGAISTADLRPYRPPTAPFCRPIWPAEWWRALLVFAQMTGWRISELLAIEWKDVDLGAGTAITRASDNKGRRDDMVALHPVVIEHIKRLMWTDSNVLPLEEDRKTLLDEFHRIQKAAGIYLPCREQRPHTCTDACHRYGFHDLRRAFATMNAANMTREPLQALMRHQSSLTTEKYINFARQIKPAVANLHVPAVLRLEGD